MKIQASGVMKKGIKVLDDNFLETSITITMANNPENIANLLVVAGMDVQIDIDDLQIELNVDGQTELIAE